VGMPISFRAGKNQGSDIVYGLKKPFESFWYKLVSFGRSLRDKNLDLHVCIILVFWG